MSFFKKVFSFVGDALRVATGIESSRAYKKAARQAEEVANQQAQQRRKELERLRGKQRTAYARAGIKLHGTPTAVIDDSQQQGQYDIDLIKLNGQQRADAYRSQAKQSQIDDLSNSIKLGTRFFL